MYYVFAVRPSNYFTIKLHYGGRFKGNKKGVPKISNYVDEKLDCIDNCDPNLMLLIELDHIIEQLGYKDSLGYYYTNKNGKLVCWLINEIVLEMYNSLWNDREVDVFVKHQEVLHLP